MQPRSPCHLPFDSRWRARNLGPFLPSLFYNAEVKTWDIIIIGGGIIGLSLALALRRRGATVLVVERGEPGREASHAAGGMLVDSGLETPAALQPLATASARMYPEFAKDLESDSGVHIDLRDNGTIIFPSSQLVHEASAFSATSLSLASLAELEPALSETKHPAFYLKERSVDPRVLTTAAWKAARHRGIDFSTGDEVTAVTIVDGRAAGVKTIKTAFHAAKVVNCAGAWSGKIGPYRFPTRPVKGQMLCLLMPSRNLLKHVIRSPQVYLIPRTDGRLLVGATVEEAGFDKRTDIATMQRFQRAAVDLIPELRNGKILEDWAGLRPGTPDALPILGPTATPGYYVATGHFRDGILLAPITAEVMAAAIEGRAPEYDLTPFSPERFH
jgi:glycine oxidase